MRVLEVLELHAEDVSGLSVQLVVVLLLLLAGDLVVSAVEDNRQVGLLLGGHRGAEVLDQVVHGPVDQRKAQRLHVPAHQNAHDVLHLLLDPDFAPQNDLGLLYLIEEALVLHENHFLEVHDCFERLA